MSSRLVVDLKSGHLDVEGSEELIRLIYEDFRSDINRNLDPKIEKPEGEKSGEEKAPEKKRRKRRGQPSLGSGDGKKSTIEEPKVESDLDINGLVEAFDSKRPTGNPQILLVCAAFLRDSKGINPCSVNQLYTCYWALRAKTKIPARFRQAIIDTVNKKKWIEWRNTNEVSITNIGENALQHELGK